MVHFQDKIRTFIIIEQVDGDQVDDKYWTHLSG